MNTHWGWEGKDFSETLTTELKELRTIKDEENNK